MDFFYNLLNLKFKDSAVQNMKHLKSILFIRFKRPIYTAANILESRVLI